MIRNNPGRGKRRTPNISPEACSLRGTGRERYKIWLELLMVGIRKKKETQQESSRKRI